MDLELTRVFVKVIQNGSFTRAAEILKMPKSNVSKAIARLESETATKLVLRTTRSLTLTAAGRAFYEASLGPVTQLEDAQKAIHGQDGKLTGLIRITAPEDLGAYVVAPAVSRLLHEHPNLSFDLVYTDRIVDLVKDGFDLAVRLGKPSDSNLKLKKAGQVRLIAVASPKYLKGKDPVRQPSDLKNFACLSRNTNEFITHWQLQSAKATLKVPVQSKISSNQMSSLLRAALADGGIALIPNYLCEVPIQKGELVHVLPDWRSPAINVSILSPLMPSTSARLKIAVDRIAAAVSRAVEY